MQYKTLQDWVPQQVVGAVKDDSVSHLFGVGGKTECTTFHPSIGDQSFQNQ